jgi:hypothetical protein
METIGLAALSLGMVFVGSCSDAISGAILEVGPGTSAPVSGAAAHLFGEHIGSRGEQKQPDPTQSNNNVG